jgi:drug/metabolite transporter (DMT)-like permease
VSPAQSVPLMVRMREAAGLAGDKKASIAWLAVAAHSGFGLYVVLIKFLSPRLPIFLALGFSFSLTALVALALAWRELRWDDFRQPAVWVLSFFLIVRSVLKLLAVQYTLAAYVQLIDMIVPFLTPIAAWLLMRETIPPRTIPALIATSIGSFLVITTNPFDLHLPEGHADLIGIAIAFGSSLAMAFLVAFMRQLSTSRFSAARVCFFQSSALAVAYCGLGVAAGEGLAPFLTLSPRLWVIYALFTLFAVVGATITQVVAISRTNSSLYSSLLSWRLIVAVGMGWLILGERLRTWWQVLGILVVIGALTLYLHYQASRSRSGLEESQL